MYGLPQNYNPFGPHGSRTAPAPPDVPLSQFQAAQNVNATHLSADGKIAYDERQSSVWYCNWDEETKAFGYWFKVLDYSGLPANAVRMP
jgi:hypothetical protein